jgi:hypothetical protein
MVPPEKISSTKVISFYQIEGAEKRLPEKTPQGSREKLRVARRKIPQLPYIESVREGLNFIMRPTIRIMSRKRWTPSEYYKGNLL